MFPQTRAGGGITAGPGGFRCRAEDVRRLWASFSFCSQRFQKKPAAPHDGNVNQSELSDETQRDPEIQIFKGDPVSRVILSLQAAPSSSQRRLIPFVAPAACSSHILLKTHPCSLLPAQNPTSFSFRRTVLLSVLLSNVQSNFLEKKEKGR